ncbi:hypothetical protein BH09GEM1_BH09GEM1_09350 [soil metagenome]
MTSSVFNTDTLYRLLIAQVDDYAIFALDTDGRVRTWNPGAERFKGYTADEIIGRDFSVFYSPQDVQRGLPSSLLARAKAEGHVSDEGWRVRKDGTRFWASVVITALRDDLGQHVGFAKITRDLTERRAAEERHRELVAQEAAYTASRELTGKLERTNEQLEAMVVNAEEARDALAASERFARGILESIADPFVVLDADWRYRFVNAPAATMLERSAQAGVASGESAVGRSVWDLFPDIVGSEQDRQMRAAVELGVTKAFETFNVQRGEWSLVHCYPLPDGGLAVQWRDITEARRAEEASRYLARASDLLNRSLEYEVTLGELARLVVPELADWCAVDIVDEDGVLGRLVVAHVDPAKVSFAREFNERYPADPAAPTGSYEVLRTSLPELYPEVSDEMLVAGARSDEHLRISRELGIRSALLVPLSAGSATYGVLTLVSAESGRRFGNADLDLAMELAHRAAIAVQNARLHASAVRAQQAAEQAQHVAENANRVKSQFLATMSHELRTPLNAIGGYVQLLLLGVKGPISAEQADYLSRVTRSQKYLLSMIEDLLSFARIEAGHMELRPAAMDPGQLIEEVAAVVAPQVEAAGLRLTRGPVADGVLMWADQERARQIVLNLITNAVKFTLAGGSIGLACDADESRVCFRVHDTGAGIPSDKQEAIFEAFVQLERDDRKGGAGTGLGLAISRELARAMNGDLTVESERGHGSTFILSLPRAQDPTD